MRLTDRKQLWPRLDKLGEKKVLEMLAVDQFEEHEEEEVQKWLARKIAVDALNETKVTKWVVIISAVAAVVAAVASVWGLFIK